MSIAAVPGPIVGHYRILERLGAGGMGVVYKAEDTKLGRMVALKFLPPELTRDNEAKSRFLREARSASLLDHSNICTIYDVGDTDDEQTYIAMPCYDGETLRSRIERGPLEVDEALKIAEQIARGLGKAHDSGIVHRDIKPANVMLTRDGIVKILDFGLAKLSGATDITRSNRVLGTLSYMAPEQLRSQAVGPQADLWSLGIVMYEMLTGSHPFGRGDGAAYGILNEEPAPLTSQRPDIPVDLEHIVAKLLRKDSHQRYQSANELLADLQSLRTPSSGTARSREETTLRRSGVIAAAMAPRRRLFALAAALLVTIVSTAGLWYWNVRKVDRAAVAVSPAAQPANASARLVADQVVVAPFDNRTGDATLDAVGTMVAEWTSDELSRVGVKVVPARYAREAPVAGVKQKDPAIALAEATRSGVLVAGAYYREGSKISIRAEVIDASSRKVLNVLRPAEGLASNPANAVTSASERIRDALAVRFLGPEWLRTFSPVGQCAPPKYEAWLELVQAMEATQKQGGGESYKAHVERAVALDPDSVDVRFERFLALGGLHASSKEAGEALAEVEARRNCLSPAGRLFLDSCVAWRKGQYERALEANREKMRLAPGDLESKRDVVNCLIALGRAQEALDLLTQNVGWERWLTPQTPVLGMYYFVSVVTSLHVLGDHARELQEARRCRAMFPDNGTCRQLEVDALAALGRFDEIDRRIEEATSASLVFAGDPLTVMTGAANGLFEEGHQERALPIYARVVSMIHEQPVEKRDRRLLAWICYRASRFDEAESLYASFSDEGWNEFQKLQNLAVTGAIAAAKGEPERALKIDATVQRGASSLQLTASRTGWLTFQRAKIHAKLGDREKAVALLRQAFAEGWTPAPDYYQFTLNSLAADCPVLRGYPPFEELMKPK